MQRLSLVLALAAGAAAATAAAAAPNSAAPANAFLACRTMADAAERLACYDREAAALEQAVTAKEVVILTPQDVRETRRSLFGFSLPKLPFFGDNADEPQEEREITASVASARSLGYGKWRIKLADGATWETTEASPDHIVPGAGTSVRIRRAALGSYFINIDGQRAVRAKRVG